MSYVAILALSIAGPLCIAGIFCNAYRESWLQFFGLWGMAAWCFARLSYFLHGGYADPWNMTLEVGMASYAIGTGLKVLKHARPGTCDSQDEEVGGPIKRQLFRR